MYHFLGEQHLCLLAQEAALEVLNGFTNLIYCKWHLSALELHMLENAIGSMAPQHHSTMAPRQQGTMAP